MVLIEDVDDEPTKVEAKPSSEWRRIQVVEADSDDAEEKVEPPKASRPQRVWSDPCPDLEITCSVKGIEDAKSRGNRIYVDGKLAESERWFTKAIWLYESGKVREVPGDLRCALHTNRALARLKLRRFADAEHDCSTVLEEKPENGKARYRRATARFEQGKLVPALEDAKKALLSLPADSRGEAQEMKAQIEEHLGPMAGENGSQQSKKEPTVKENGYHRIPIKEVDQEETQPNHQPKLVQEANGSVPETEPYPDIQLEPTLVGAEKAKQRANELFQKGEVAESVRWFSKAIWLLDSGTISGAAALRSILHSNRAFARSKLQQWPEVEADCNEALTFNEKNAKALFRRSHARLEMNKLDAALADVNLLLPLLAPPTNKEALDLKARIVESMERDKAQRSSQSKEPEAAAKSVAKPKESKVKEEATKPTTPSQPPAGFRRMEIVEADDSSEEEAKPAARPKEAAKPKEEPAAKPVTPSQPPAGFKRMEIVEASDDESEEEAKPAAKPKEAAKPREEPAAKPVTPSQPPAGFKRMEIVEASDDESEEEAKPAATPQEAAKPKEAPVEPFADIKLEPSVAGAEKAKDTGNKLFQEGKIEESERWFSKAIWLVEESGKVTVSETLRGILHSNRAFARLTLRQWSSAETDCNEALKLNSENPKALYRRALARKELEKFQAALDDVNQLLPKLDAQNNVAATKLKEELESKIRSAPSLNGTDTAKGKPASPSQPPAGFKRMEIVEASDDESEEDAVPEKPKQETAPTSAVKPASPPPAGFKRMEIVEASDVDEEVDAKKPKEEPKKPEQDAGKAPVEPVEPFADIQLEHSVAGVEKAKDTGNKLFQEGKLAESERWFSKAIWLAESGKVSAPENLKSILHSNRAFARLQLSQWSAAETDCDKALELNGNMAKALYRRALARKELKKFQAALDDVKQLLPLLEPPQIQNAQKLKDELESKLAAATAPAMNGKNRAEDTPAKPASPSQPPAGFKRMEILEASDDESEEETAPVAKPKEETRPVTETQKAPSEPFADIQLEHSLAGAEKAKETGNRLFQEGKIEDSERWFSKAIWLVEETGKVNAPDSLKAILHSNRAYARLQLEHWSSAEGDCSEALKLNSKNPKALYRRALARKGLKQFQGALEDVKHLLPLLDSQNNAQALKLKEELESKLGIAPLVNGSDNEKAPAPKASASRPVEPVATPAEPLRPEVQRPSSAPAEQPPSPSSGSSLARPSASARAIAATPSIPNSSPKNSMEMLRQFKSLKKHPAVLTKYITQKVSPALLQSLFNRSPIEADDLALVLQSLRTAASDEAEPLTGDRVGEYLQQLLRTHTADTQFSMLSTSEKEMVRNLAALAPNGDDLKKTFAKVL